MNHYRIRYNTKHELEGTGFVWRIFDNNSEYKARSFEIHVPMHDETTLESGVVKYNVACEGYLTIDRQGHAIISPVPQI